ncbi:hypothetical protein [Candidatus Enterovibrio escicola]|nr:hypothetical protein [Candidatus Enterovibrio escacola]
MNSGDKEKIKNRVGIEKLPAISDYKAVFCHFEIATVVGTWHKYFRLIVVNKANKFC